MSDENRIPDEREFNAITDIRAEFVKVTDERDTAIAAARWLLTCLRDASCARDGWTRQQIGGLVTDAENKFPGVFAR